MSWTSLVPRTAKEESSLDIQGAFTKVLSILGKSRIEKAIEQLPEETRGVATLIHIAAAPAAVCCVVWGAAFVLFPVPVVLGTMCAGGMALGPALLIKEWVRYNAPICENRRRLKAAVAGDRARLAGIAAAAKAEAEELERGLKGLY